MSLGLAHSKLRNQVTTLDNFQARTDQGLAFSFSYSNFSLSAGSSVSVLLRVGSFHQINLIPRFITSGESKLEIFEGPTVSADGPVIYSKNYNRSSDYLSRSIFTSPATITADGILMDTEVVPFATGGEGRSENWVLGPDGLYEFRLTNLSSQSKITCLNFDFYEIQVETGIEVIGKYVDDDYILEDYVEGTQ